jgi:hypothetical protein
MNRKTIIVSTIFSAVTALVTASAVSAVFFFYKPAAQIAETPKPVIESQPTTPTPPESTPIQQAEIKATDVNSAAIETVYKNFFPEGSKCRQTYNEMFGDRDGVYSSSSACRINLTFNRDGSAEKIIVIRRYDNAAKEWRDTDKTVWKSKISSEQFKSLANLIVNNEAFKSWNDMMMITVSNCKIMVKHTGGTKSPMSNVDERATAYLPMVNAFKELDARALWEKTE